MFDDKSVPHWARVALVARCARLCLPAFDEAWPNAPARWRDGLLAGIFSAEQSAADARLADDHREADLEATKTCGALRGYVYVMRGQLGFSYDKFEGFPEDVEKAVVAAQVATVAAQATEAARADPIGSLPIAIGAVRWAHLVAEHEVGLLDTLHDELNELKRAVKTGRWTQATPVLWTTRGWKKAGES
jgi:hypothetical protein